jgi:hypothetical protein
MLFVEVLEGQSEAGEPGAAAELHARAAGHVSCVNGAPGSLLGSLGGGRPPVVQFGRRETYGIALTGVGAQHQHAFMQAVGHGPAGGPLGSSLMGGLGGPAAPGGGVPRAHTPSSADAHESGSQAGSAAASSACGRGSGPSGPATEAASTAACTPGGLSPAPSLSSHLRSSAGSPVPGSAPPHALAAAPAPAPAGEASSSLPGPPPPVLRPGQQVPPLPPSREPSAAFLQRPPLPPGPPPALQPHGAVASPTPSRAVSNVAGLLEDVAAAAAAMRSGSFSAVAGGPGAGPGASRLTAPASCGSGAAAVGAPSLPNAGGAIVIPTRRSEPGGQPSGAGQLASHVAGRGGGCSCHGHACLTCAKPVVACAVLRLIP